MSENSDVEAERRHSCRLSTQAGVLTSKQACAPQDEYGSCERHVVVVWESANASKRG